MRSCGGRRLIASSNGTTFTQPESVRPLLLDGRGDLATPMKQPYFMDTSARPTDRQPIQQHQHELAESDQLQTWQMLTVAFPLFNSKLLPTPVNISVTPVPFSALDTAAAGAGAARSAAIERANAAGHRHAEAEGRHSHAMDAVGRSHRERVTRRVPGDGRRSHGAVLRSRLV